jgi:hypothetical protein
MPAACSCHGTHFRLYRSFAAALALLSTAAVLLLLLLLLLR